MKIYADTTRISIENASVDFIMDVALNLIRDAVVLTPADERQSLVYDIVYSVNEVLSESLEGEE